MTGLWIFAAVSFLGFMAYAFQLWAVRAALKTASGNDAGSPASGLFVPPISILKPLKGLDDNLFDNLESFCNLDYPEYEIIFSFQNRNDQAFKVAGKIRDKYPHRDISLVVEPCNAGLNPKVNNLIPAYRRSKHNLVLISDSNVMVGEDYLKEIVKHMENPEVGLVSNVIKGVGSHSMGSVLENLHLNSFILGSVCFLDRFMGMPCVIGKSMLMRKSDLDAIGGFDAVKDFLAEDYVIGQRMHQSGRKVVLSNYAIHNVNSSWGLDRFINRHTRWGKLRWQIGGVKYLSELLCNPVFMAFLPVVLWGPSRATLCLVLSASLIKIAGDYYIGTRVLSGVATDAGRIDGTVPRMSCYLLVPLKDILIGGLWFVPLISSTVAWRGNRYRIGKDSQLFPLASGLQVRTLFSPAMLLQKAITGTLRMAYSIRERSA
jgi:ceramide glucosyltransferase